MVEEEFKSLSDEAIDGYKNKSLIGNIYPEEDVRKAVKRLKEFINKLEIHQQLRESVSDCIQIEINKICGEKLI